MYIYVYMYTYIYIHIYIYIYAEYNFPYCSYVKNRVAIIFQKFFRNSVQVFQIYYCIESFKNTPFAQGSECTASANTKKSKWQIFGPSTHRAKVHNFRKPAIYTIIYHYIPITYQYITNIPLLPIYTIRSRIL